MKRKMYSRGGTSLFIVIFTTLMLTIITTSFIQTTMRHQQQASNADLSQSAYDSAMVGVEDAKRALLALRECEIVADGDAVCDGVKGAFLDSQNCEFLQGTGIGVSFASNNEVMVGKEAQNQAYTCVKVKTDSESFDGSLLANTGSKLIPLRSDNAFSKVRISWFMNKDVAATGAIGAPPASLTTLPATWPANAPSVMRTQLIQFAKGGPVNTAQLDTADGARTLFLRPSSGGGTTSNFALDDRNSSINSLISTSCQTGTVAAYSCSTVLTLPTDSSNRMSYLNLSAIYNTTHFKVELLGDDNSLVSFSNVQPEVDSTGRASDFFRRVRAKVSIGSSDPTVPDAALQVTGNICKDFAVTNNAGEYQRGSCTP